MKAMVALLFSNGSICCQQAVHPMVHIFEREELRNVAIHHASVARRDNAMDHTMTLQLRPCQVTAPTMLHV
jgi:hypothetical protein